MTRFSRVRQRCGTPPPRSTEQVERPVEDPLLNELLRVAQDGDDVINRAILSGQIVEEPLQDRSRDGDPVTVLLISFAAPDERSPHGSCCCEIEIPEPVADSLRGRLRPGRRILVLGQFTGAGGIWANSILPCR